MTDEELAVELKRSSSRRPAHQPDGELLARHWVAVFSYATLCTSGPQYAGMLTTAAFTRVFEESLRQSGPSAAWRPHLLVKVRHIAGEWDTDGRRMMLHPGLRPGQYATDRAAVRLLPPDGRKLVSRAFHRLPERARCILWHAEVEAEDLAVPAALLGITPEDAAVKVTHARELLRDVCVRAHRESAPDEECRRFSRLLDVSLRRGDMALDPDLRQHVAGCPHCRHTADQLGHFDGRLAVLLAEAVLGWGARAYLDSRPGRGREPERTAGDAQSWHADERVTAPDGASPRRAGPVAGVSGASRHPAGPVGWGEGYLPAGRPARSAGPRHAVRTGPRLLDLLRSPSGDVPGGAGPSRLARRQLALAVLVASGCVLVPLVLTSGGGSDSMANAPSDGASSTERTPGTQPSGIAAGDLVSGPLEGRLRNAGSGLCAGIDGTKAVAGTEVVLTTCTASVRQQWSYETGGLLRSLAGPELCLDSRLGFSVRLGSCADPTRQGSVRYDFTLEGNLLPRGGLGLTLAPASADEGAILVLKERTDDAASQLWAVDNSVESLQIESVSRMTDGSPTPKPARPTSPTPPSPKPEPRPSASSPPPSPTPSPPYPSYPTADPCRPYHCWPYRYGYGGSYGYGQGGRGGGG